MQYPIFKVKFNLFSLVIKTNTHSVRSFTYVLRYKRVFDW